METRIKDKLGIDIKVKIFHALEYELLFEYLSLYIYPYQDPSNFSSLGDFYKRNKLTGLQGIKDKINDVLGREENKILNSVVQKINHFMESYKDNKKKKFYIIL